MLALQCPPFHFPFGQQITRCLMVPFLAFTVFVRKEPGAQIRGEMILFLHHFPEQSTPGILQPSLPESFVIALVLL